MESEIDTHNAIKLNEYDTAENWSHVLTDMHYELIILIMAVCSLQWSCY